MKKALFLISGGVVIFTSVFLISYYSFSFFNDKSDSEKVDTLEISLSDEKKLNLIDQIPINVKDIDSVEPYNFSIKNPSENRVKYEILLEDDVSNDNSYTLDRKYLQYQLRNENKVLVTKNVQNIKNNIIYVDTIAAKQTKKYDFRMALIENLEDELWVGKTYGYSIKINPIVT